MNHVVLLTHGEFSKGIAQSCEFILGNVPGFEGIEHHDGNEYGTGCRYA